MTSCQDEDFGYAKDQIAYETNFKKAFGEIPADQSWDLSSAANWVDPLKADEATGETRATRAGGALPYTPQPESEDSWWEVPNDIFSWMQKRLIEGNDNRYLGSSFILETPSSDFAIIPIFQGNSAITSELEVKVNDFELTKVWGKSEGMKATDTENDGDAKPLGYYEGWAGYDKYYDTTPLHPASTIKAKKVWTKPILFKNSELGTGKYMYLSLHNIAKLYNSDGSVWDSGNTWTTRGDRLTSINPAGHMLALEVDWSIKNSLKSSLPKIVSGKEPSQMMIIGCEDANGTSSDHDNNDIVFLIVGYPDVPNVIPLTETIEKRYMCEDLGGTHDFDFNDIVVDVKQVSTYTLTTSPDVTDWNFNSGTTSVEISGIDRNNCTRTQTAKIAHVCGTIPIQAQVGNYLFPWITDPTNQSQTRTQLLAGGWNWNGSSWVPDVTSNNKTRGTQPADGWNPNEEKVIADNSWNPSDNNVTIYVQWPEGWKADPGHSVNINGTNANQSHSYLDQAQLAKALSESGWVGVDYKDFTERLKKVAFPENGTVPYIIAVDPSVNWMKEDQRIDMAWLRQADHTDKDHTNESGAGSGGYYENPDSSKPEVLIWQGSFTGEKWNHGLDFPVGSAQYNGIIDAFDGYAQCNTLNIYFDRDYTDRKNDGKVLDKTISLATHDWKRLTDSEADNYVAPRNVTPVTIDGKQCYKLQIKLTDEQILAIRNGGLVVQLSSDNVMLHKISFTKESGFEVRLNMPDNGKITTPLRNRVRYGDHASEAKVPFTHASFVSGSVTFEAVPDEGYVLKEWRDNSGNVVSTSSSITISASTTLTAVFEKTYRVCFTPQHDPGNGEGYKYDLGGKCHLNITCNGNTVQDEYWAKVGDVLTLTPVPAEGYKFVQWWSGYSDIPRTYTVSAPSEGTDLPIYGVFREKEDPQLALTDASQTTIVLDYNTPSVDIAWTKTTTSEVKFKGYDYATEVNIWRNGENNSHHMRAQTTNFNNKKITMYVEENDTYKSAQIELDVTVKDYVSSVYNGYRVPISNNIVESSKIKDALHLDVDKNTKNIKIQVKRDTGIAASASIYSKTHESDWVKVIRSDEKWTSFARGNESYSDVSFGMQPRSICFIISASDFKNYFKEWNAGIVFDALKAGSSEAYTGWQEVYVSLTDDAPFQ